MRILKCRLTTIETLLGTANLSRAMRPMRRAERKKLRRLVWMR